MSRFYRDLFTLLGNRPSVLIQIPGYAPGKLSLTPDAALSVQLSDGVTYTYTTSEVQELCELLISRGFITDEDTARPRYETQWLFACLCTLDGLELGTGGRLFVLDRAFAFSNNDISILFRVQNQGGIRWSRVAARNQPDLVVLISQAGATQEMSHGSRDGEAFYYTGQGSYGDQTLTGGNAVLVSAKETNAPVFLFTKHTNSYHYGGRVLIEEVIKDTDPDKDLLPRFVYKFKLRTLRPAPVLLASVSPQETAVESAHTTASGVHAFRPKARLVQSLLGKDLVSNELVAILELVKNGYDADATHVTVTINPEQDLIRVWDNGHGMSLETVQNAWLVPATNSKVKSPRSKSRLRRVLGNKGVGRFAASRLGNRLRLITLADRQVFPDAPQEEVHVDLDWGQFDDPEAYLDEIALQWHTMAPADPPNPGTSLEISELASDIAWSRHRVEELRLLLARLVSPFDEVNDFQVELETPYDELNGPVLPLPMLSQPHYAIKGKVDANGVCHLQYRSFDGEPINITMALDSSHLTAGPFEVELRAWSLDEEDLKTVASQFQTNIAQVKRALAKAVGISIYRDGFRVLPYGEPRNDWLRLDLRRVQNPTLRLSNNQIIGAVFLSSDANPLLKDQSNREGLIDNQAVDDLRHAILEILSEIEVRRYQSRRRKPQQDNPSQTNLSLADIRQNLLDKYPNDTELISKVDARQAEITHHMELMTRSVVQYRRLATLGRLIDMILHDGRNPLTVVRAQAQVASFRINQFTADCQDEQVGKSLSTIVKQGDRLTKLFNKLEPLGGREKRQAQHCKLESVIEDTIAVYEGALQAAGVDVDTPSSTTMVYIDPSELQQVIVNLVDNSLYWLKTIDRSDRQIRFDVFPGDSVVRLLVSDSGPGVTPSNKDFIFDAYYSSKPEADGKGLGLFIAAEIVRESDGLMQLVEDGPLPGACFQIDLKAGQPE